MGGITDVMKQADLYRQEIVGQMYAAEGGRIGYADAGEKYYASPINLLIQRKERSILSSGSR